MYNSRSSPRKMVRNKRDLKFSPHRNRPISRTVSRVGSKPPDSATLTSCANVKVVVRVRPPNHKEAVSNSRIMDRWFDVRPVVYRTIIKIADDSMIIFDPKEEDEPFFYHGVQQRGRDLLKKANKNIEFSFDRVFGFDANNAEVFNNSTKNLIPSLMDGYNCSVFVYGATGAGKTHTMLGHSDNPGITFLTMRELFAQMDQFNSEREFNLAITYLEVYNETVKDLLNPGAPLHLREDGKFGVIVSGIKIHQIRSPEELFALLAEGNGNRTQHPTDANAESSRSHAVFQVYVNMQFRNTGQRRIAKLSMIDLAGSERGAATGCTGIRFTEGANINKSLLALGNCINSLADGQRHIPYRDSKLTRILKDSLGGNCQTVMIANISPSNLNYEDTYNTLKYAMRAKKIKSNMTKNVVNNVLTIAQYQKLVEDLNKENEKLKAEINVIKSENETTSSTSICTCNDNTANIPILNKEPTWKAQLQPMLQEKVSIQKQIQRLLHSEEILKLRIKFKDFSESIMTDCCVEDEQIETDRNRMQSTVGTQQRKLSSVQAQIQDLKSHLRMITTKIQNLIESEEIPTNNCDLLQTEIDFKNFEIDLQRKHTSNILDICQAEIEQKEKMMAKMLDVLNNYYQSLKINGGVSNNMADEYLNIIRMARRVRSVTWQDENADVPETKSQDSGININRTPVLTPKYNTKSFTPVKSLGSCGNRTTVKRKLYEVETKSTSAIDNFIKKHLTADTESKTMTNLNETVIITDTINGDNNSTFYIRNKDSVPKKKSALHDRSNENILSKGSILKKSTLNEKSNVRTTNNKLYGTTSKPQKFPLRKNTKDTASGSRAAKPSNGTLRVNRFKP